MASTVAKRNRRLDDNEKVFTQNAWDDTEWTSEMLEEAEKKIQIQREESSSSSVQINEVESNVTTRWDEFYKAHQDKFFKDRRWILSEFQEILSGLNKNSSPCKILEVGCGVGNAVATILNSNENNDLHIFCCDLSKNAIKTLKERPLFIKDQDKITAFRADICIDFRAILHEIQAESLDFIMLIFTLSALKPELMKSTVRRLASLLKPGGLVLFRDYAQNDMTQLRFKSKAYLCDNYYVRADGTTSYFFSKRLVDDIFTSAGLVQVELKNDNRMLVNRLKSLKMCRCWIQAKYRKHTNNSLQLD